MGLLRLMDKDLVKKAANGDSGAFSILVGRWEKRLFNYAFRLTGDREDALDVCQDTFLKAYQQMAQLQDFSKFSGWLFKIARNFCISHYRSKTRSGSLLNFVCWLKELWTKSPLNSGKRSYLRYMRDFGLMKSLRLLGVH